MRTRLATHQDLDVLVALVAALFAEDSGTRDLDVDPTWPQAHGRPYYTNLLADPRSLVLLAQPIIPGSSKVVGFLIGRLQDANPLRPRVQGAELESMYITRPWRSHGVGRDLVEHFHRWACDHRATSTAVTAYTQNTAALRFYRTLGYHDHQTVLGRPAHHQPPPELLHKESDGSHA